MLKMCQITRLEATTNSCSSQSANLKDKQCIIFICTKFKLPFLCLTKMFSFKPNYQS